MVEKRAVQEPQEYGQSCKKQFYLDEFLQITWCIYAKQKYGKASDLLIATYENAFDYSFNFASILLRKGWSERFDFVWINFQNIKNFQWSI